MNLADTQAPVALRWHKAEPRGSHPLWGVAQIALVVVALYTLLFIL